MHQKPYILHTHYSQKSKIKFKRKFPTPSLLLFQALYTIYYTINNYSLEKHTILARAGKDEAGGAGLGSTDSTFII
jgi:hypothetical protein